MRKPRRVPGRCESELLPPFPKIGKGWGTQAPGRTAPLKQTKLERATVPIPKRNHFFKILRAGGGIGYQVICPTSLCLPIQNEGNRVPPLTGLGVWGER